MNKKNLMFMASGILLIAFVVLTSTNSIDGFHNGNSSHGGGGNSNNGGNKPGNNKKQSNSMLTGWM
jgi:hypothetical protein